MTEDITGEETWLSQEAFDRLTKELEHLKGPGRVEIAERIEAARDEGDLKENGGYHAAREEQGKHCLLYTSPSPRDATLSRMPSSA